MNINKTELTNKFREGDMNYVFSEAEKISDYVVSYIFKIYDEDLKEDMKQECLENFWKKIVAGKVREDGNIFSFIWTNSKNRILEILRKETRRKGIATFVPYDTLEEELSGVYDLLGGVGDRYERAVF